MSWSLCPKPWWTPWQHPLFPFAHKIISCIFVSFAALIYTNGDPSNNTESFDISSQFLFVFYYHPQWKIARDWIGVEYCLCICIVHMEAYTPSFICFKVSCWPKKKKVNFSNHFCVQEFSYWHPINCTRIATLCIMWEINLDIQ